MMFFDLGVKSWIANWGRVKATRLDLLCVFFGMPLLLGLVFAMGWLPVNSHVRPPVSSPLYFGMITAIIFLGLTSELRSLQAKNGIVNTGDSGFVSAIINITALLYVPVIDRFVIQLLPVKLYSLLFYMAGVALFLIGIWLRGAAVKTLGRQFSHSLIILQDHRLIRDGLYRSIRHPAYLGSLCIMLGSSWMFLTHIGMFVVFACVPLVVYRIRNEERLLVKHFGDEYSSYMGNSFRLIPFVY